MPELRKDPVVGRWVIISEDRGKRPSDWSEKSPQLFNGFCPFCPGNEDKTPQEIVAVRPDGSAANSPGWQIRVVPNKFPALQIEGELHRRGEGLYDMMNGIGAHEVIIETPDHTKDFNDFDDTHVFEVLRIYKERVQDLRNDIRMKYVLVFKNHGLAAGASLAHAHSQLIATPILPKRVVEELEGAREHFERKERCIFCDIVYQELAYGKRIITENEAFIVISPFAARFPYEMWVLPRRHISHFENTEVSQFQDLARILKEALFRLNTALDFPPYNFVIHSSPIQETPIMDYHWHLEIIPKLTKIAGFEWGSGFYINPVPPEVSAAQLRDCA